MIADWMVNIQDCGVSTATSNVGVATGIMSDTCDDDDSSGDDDSAQAAAAKPLFTTLKAEIGCAGKWLTFEGVDVVHFEQGTKCGG